MAPAAQRFRRQHGRHIFDIGNYVEKTGGTVIGSRIKLLGVLYSGPVLTQENEIKVVTIPTAQVPVALSKSMVNLGFVIKAQQLKAFDKVFADN